MHTPNIIAFFLIFTYYDRKLFETKFFTIFTGIIDFKNKKGLKPYFRVIKDTNIVNNIKFYVYFCKIYCIYF